MKTLALCTACYPHPTWWTSGYLRKFLSTPIPEGWSLFEADARAQPVTLCRERIAEMAMENGADVLLWIDSDVTTRDPSDLWRLVEGLLGMPSEVWLLGAPVRNQETAAAPNLSVGRCPDPATFDVPFPVDGIGFGLVAVRRVAFERIRRPWFEFLWQAKLDARPRGEDMTFCDRIWAAGGEVWADPRIPTAHWFASAHWIDLAGTRERGPIPKETRSWP